MKKIDNLCIVDDDEAFKFLTSMIIEESNRVEKIMTFSNGRETIEFLESVKNQPEKLPEIILLDLNMPIMDGWEFLDKYICMKPRIGKKITIYIVSSSINPKDIQRAKLIGEVSDFIIKPVTEEKFHELLESL